MDIKVEYQDTQFSPEVKNGAIISYNCTICGGQINKERVEGLQFLSTPVQNYTCLSCAAQHNKTVKAIYNGEAGTSDLIYTDFVSSESGIKRG